MALYTVMAFFADSLVGIGQYRAATPEEAVKSFVATSRSLAGRNVADLRTSILENGDVSLTHLADGVHGVWLWNVPWGDDLADVEVVAGYVVQTSERGAGPPAAKGTQ